MFKTETRELPGSIIEKTKNKPVGLSLKEVDPRISALEDTLKSYERQYHEATKVYDKKRLDKLMQQTKRKIENLKLEAKKTSGAIRKTTNTLEQGAKSKSFNEFIKSQEKIYHGTYKDNVFNEFDLNKANSGVGSNMFDQGNVIYLTKSEKAANFFSKLANDNKILASGKFPKDGSGSVLNFYLSKDAKIKNIKDMPRGGRIEEANNIINQAKKEGYDAISFKDKGFNTIKGSKEVFDIINSEGLPETIIILNPKALKTKSQLKEIWEKANK